MGIIPATQRIAEGYQGGIPWKHRALGMLAVPVSPRFPLAEAGKAAGFSWQSRVGALEVRMDVGDESSRVSLEISAVFPTLSPAPALPWLGLLKGRKTSSKFWESDSCVSYSSRFAWKWF